MSESNEHPSGSPDWWRSREGLPTPIIGDGVKVTQIPPAPMSEEDLKLKCLELAVRQQSGIPTRGSGAVIQMAEKFRKYVRPNE